MAMPATERSQTTTVQADLVYLANLDVKPVIHYTQPGLPRRDGNYGHFPVAIESMREIEGLSLDREGFELWNEPIAVSDFYDAAVVEQEYYPQLSDFVKHATGATEALVFDHTIRIEGGGEEESTVMRAPVRFVHNDYTEDSAPKRVRDLLPQDEAQQWVDGRFIELNVWRPIEGPVLMTPLALCDARSIKADDLRLTNLLYPDRIGEIYHALYNPAHRWFYSPRMTTDEAILIKGYDSARDGRARFTFHSAFDDPQTPKNPPPRKSIEARVLARMES
jgi:hypothetical protein